MNGKRCFIVTVGTSLIDKYNEYCENKPTEKINKSAFDNWHIYLKNNNTEFELKELKYVNQLDSNQSYTNEKNRIWEWLNKIPNFPTCSAELHSLYSIKPSPNNNDLIILIGTITMSSILCTDVLKEFLENKKINNIKCIFPKGLGKPDKGDEFINEGLLNFVSILTSLIQKYENEYEIILIPTGGYKSLIPYVTITGILHEKEIKYIYEDSENLLTLPSLPINLDIEKWKTNYLKLEILTSLPKSNSEPFYKNLEEPFKNLLEEPSDGNQPYKYNTIGEFLKDRYLQLRHMTPLQLQMKGTTLLKFLKRDKSKPDLSEFFSQLVNIGPHLWIGDKIPEMIEHAQYHHTNLFEIAETLLLPILEKNKNFLSPEEIFILLCTIYFHDCGHVVDKLGDTILLPTQIRDYHHILGYERIRDIYWQKELKGFGIDWTDENSLWNKYLHSIATIGLYHRKKMPLKNGESYYFCPVNNEGYEPLENRVEKEKLKFEDSVLSSKRVLLITALFRIIDSLDTQSFRLGTEEEIKMKAAILLNDIKTEETRKEMVENIVKNHFTPCKFDEIQELAKIITGKYKQTEAPVATNPSEEELNIDEKIGKITSDEFKKSLIFLYLEAYCREFFKREQPKHYLKHLSIKKINISHSYEENPSIKHHINIEFIFHNEETLEKYCEFFKVNKKDIPKPEEIVKNIEDEYCKVKDILNENEVEISYKVRKDISMHRV